MGIHEQQTLLGNIFWSTNVKNSVRTSCWVMFDQHFLLREYFVFDHLFCPAILFSLFNRRINVLNATTFDEFLAAHTTLPSNRCWVCCLQCYNVYPGFVTGTAHIERMFL